MKAALLAYVVGLLLITVYSTECPKKCGRNMETTPCPPCNQICGQGPPRCPLLPCRINQTFCKCKENFCLPRPNSKFCVPIKKCKNIA